MIIYFSIGVIVQLIVLAERALRFPERWTDESLEYSDFWVWFIGMIIVNVLLWPLTIVCEIYAIIKGI